MSHDRQAMKLEWNPLYILGSLFISFVGSYISITLIEQYRVCRRMGKSKLASPMLLLVLTVLNIGGVAIWCMHFLGMAAVTMISPSGKVVRMFVRHDLTALSFLVMIAFVLGGFYIGISDRMFAVNRRDVLDEYIAKAQAMSIEDIRNMSTAREVIGSALFANPAPLLTGGLCVACGMCVMHYVGMMAMVFDGEMRWNVGIIAASCLIAIIASTIALWIIFRQLAIYYRLEYLRVLSAALMSIAVNGMHYTGMAAAEFIYIEGNSKRNSAAVGSIQTAAFTALLIAAVFLAAGFILASADMRIWYQSLVKVNGELESRLLQALNNDSAERRVAFYAEYMKLREGDCSDKCISEFRKMSDGLLIPSFGPAALSGPSSLSGRPYLLRVSQEPIGAISIPL